MGWRSYGEGTVLEAIAEIVWNVRYRLIRHVRPDEPDIQETWSRVAFALSAVEVQHREDWCHHFRAAVLHFKFLAGRHPHAILFKNWGGLTVQVMLVPCCFA